jgi:hypothetical protein
MRFRCVLLFALLIGVACSSYAGETAPDHAGQSTRAVSRRVGNVQYFFPAGTRVGLQDTLVASCTSAIAGDLSLIGATEFKEHIEVRFLRTREDMRRSTGLAASGMAFPEKHTLFSLASIAEAPIRHEMMHLIAMLQWGTPPESSTWMNEGLATLADNNCNGFTDEEVFRFLLEKSMLVPIDSLATRFYGQPEMVAYHQSGFVVQHLLRAYGVEKFKAVWKQGFGSFAGIYGVPFGTVEADLERRARLDFPTSPAIDWEAFKEGCL